MKPSKNPLQKQLEEEKFKHGIAYVQHAANSIKKLNSAELAHLNKILTGSDEDPWRFSPMKVQLPSGQVHEMNIISNPLNRAREIVGDAVQLAGNSNPLEAASYIYAQLVLEHLFKDANRRTAVLATLWLLHSQEISVDPYKLLLVAIGDLRNQQDRQTLTQKIKDLI